MNRTHPLHADELRISAATFVEAEIVADDGTYALVKVKGLPLLYKGDDSGHTDITSAL